MTHSWKRNAALFLASQALSLLGSALVQYALLWQVTLETRSGVLMTLYIVAGFLPTFLLSPFAGVWADRYDRRRLIIAADALIALTTLALALVLSIHGEALWLFFVAAAVRSACTVALGVVPLFWLYLGAMGLFGVALPLFNTPATVMLQERVEPNFLGRVFGVLTMLNTSLMPLSMLLYGPLAG